MKRVVKVLGQAHEINVQRKYKTVWVVVGEYMGERIQVKGKTDTEAMAAWCDAVRHKGS